MIAPFFKLDYFGFDVSLLVALIIGISFGFFLERGGLGSSPKLAAQFYFTDFTVFKVMFTAVITAMIGLYWLGKIGVLDLHLVYKSPTYITPYIVGGIIFGIGFVTSGLCPGTSCVSVATGRIDGLFTLLGLLFGIFIFGETFDKFQDFFYSGSMGKIILPDLWSIKYGILVLGVVIAALLGFIGVEAIEKKISFKTRFSQIIKSKTSGMKVLSAIAFILAFIAVFAGDPFPKDNIESEITVNSKTYKYIQPEEIAAKIMKRKKDFILIDVRTSEEYKKYHIPFAKAEFPQETTDKTIILVSKEKLPEEILTKFRSNEVQILFGGMKRWKEKVLFPDIARLRKLSDDELNLIRKTSRFFGGKPVNDMINPKDRKFSREGCG